MTGQGGGLGYMGIDTGIGFFPIDRRTAVWRRRWCVVIYTGEVKGATSWACLSLVPGDRRSCIGCRWREGRITLCRAAGA